MRSPMNPLHTFVSRTISIRLLVLSIACGLIFEFVAFGDFDGARADDLALLAVGGSTAGNTPPANIMFLFDSSMSMNDLICEDLTGTAKCDQNSLIARTAPNGSTVCESAAMRAATGPDVTGDGAVDPYRYLFDRNLPTSWRGYSLYPIFDVRKSGANDDMFLSTATFTHNYGGTFNEGSTGSGSSDQVKIEDAIASECGGITDCGSKSRCIYSLRTQGYYWEKSTCGSGDPMGICTGCGEGTGHTGDECAAASDCDSRRCVAGASCNAGSVANAGVCSVASDCNSRYCQAAAGCGFGSTNNGSACTQAANCASRRCVNLSCNAGAKAAGVACSSYTECQSRRCGSASSPGVCVACSGTATGCQSGDVCTSGKCGLRGCGTLACQQCLLDADCTGTDTCTSGICSTSGCADKHCQACTGNSNCPSGETCSGGLCRAAGCGSGTCQACAHDNECPGTEDCNSSHVCRATGCTPGAGSSSGVNHGLIALGDYLNFYPPKGIALIKAFSETIKNMAGDARMGVSDFRDVGSGNVAFAIKPPCSQSTGTDCFDGNPATECFPQNDSQLENYLYNTLAFSTFTPIAKALDNVGAYYGTTTGVNTPICDYSTMSACGDANNFVVAISDGIPFSDATRASDLPWSSGTGHITTLTDGYFATNGYWVDDVAKALSQIDHRADITGIQAVNTYSVSFGLLDATDPSKCVGVLEQTAIGGGGRCLPATSVTELRTALAQIVTEIIKRARGFTAPSVPATRLTGSTSLQNAVFRPSDKFPLWEGHLFGFDVCDEKLGRLTGTTCSCLDAGNDNEVCIQDVNGRAVTFDDDGYLMSTPAWDAQLCLSGDAAGSLGAIPPDQSNLDVDACYRTADETSTDPLPRVIYTAVEHGGASATTLTYDDQIPFTLAALSDAHYGTAFLTALNVAGVLADGQKLVGFFRGLDTGDADGDLNTTEDRNLNNVRDGAGTLKDGWWKLGDTFHSIPNVVQRPDGRGLGTWAGTASYGAFATQWGSRKKVILVGANDGMIHAFDAGHWSSTTSTYDGGTGTELWAFVSPELLPKLKTVCDPATGACGLGNHKFMVDGSVMVREVWTGGTADKADVNNKTYWKTVAIYGHRQGGSTYVALDVTDIESPRLLWVFPQASTLDGAGNPVTALMGESWLDVFPAPASIGPLSVDADNNPATPVMYDRWVALLSAGYNALDTKGRALFMVDAWTGALVWSAQKATTGVYADMKFSFPATPTFYTLSSGTYPFIAGVVAADHGGQLWSLTPHTIPAFESSGLYTLDAEVVFRTEATAINTDLVGGNNNGILDAAEYQRHPFFFAPTLTRHGSWVRVIIGTGDRDTLIPDTTRNTTIQGYVCTDTQRLYAIDLRSCPNTAGGTRPCTEADLVHVTLGATPVYASDLDRGWYFVLPAGEKVATPFEIFNGYAMYSTFLPTTACGSAGSVCSPDSKGMARLYARHYLSGGPLDWNGDKTISSSEEVVTIGEGVPTAPAVSTAIAGGSATPTLFVGASDSGLVANSAAGLTADLVMEILRFPVTKGVHDCLHAGVAAACK
jgi:hypothetical protein